MNKVAIHKEICERLNEIYKCKNHDYGDSFAKLRQRLPDAILVRLFDKYLRLETLLRQVNAPMVSESIEDTLMDLANYCIMELMERKVADKGEKSDEANRKSAQTGGGQP